jgi:hypothetical protein
MAKVLARPLPPIPELEYTVELSDSENSIDKGAAMQNGIDIRTLNGALDYLDYHAPTEETLPKHRAVNAGFKELMVKIYGILPDGPGKTVAIRAIGRARMECNSAIATGGA